MRRAARGGYVRVIPPQPAKGAMRVRLAVMFHRSCLVALAGLLIAAPASLAADPVFTEFTGGVAPGFSANTKPDGIGRGPDGNVWMTAVGRSRTDREGHPGGRGDGVHGRRDAGSQRQPRADGRGRGPGRQPVGDAVHQPRRDRADHARGSGDRVSARRRTATRRGSRSGPTAICGSSSRPTRGGSRRSRPPARSAPSPRAARTSRPTAFRARSRSGRTATSGSPRSPARGGSGGSRRRVW